jgi:outer membrane protein OmpA-like peptidoglycan-associated protein
VDVTDIYLDKVNQLITVLNENPDMNLEMHAHSDKSEMKAGETNEALKDIAQKRADNVLKVLTAAGINTSRIRVKVHNDAEPTTSETSEVGKAKNRRVEFHVQI